MIKTFRSPGKSLCLQLTWYHRFYRTQWLYGLYRHYHRIITSMFPSTKVTFFGRIWTKNLTRRSAWREYEYVLRPRTKKNLRRSGQDNSEFPPCPIGLFRVSCYWVIGLRVKGRVEMIAKPRRLLPIHFSIASHDGRPNAKVVIFWE